MISIDKNVLQKAVKGDISSLALIYKEFEPQLKSYLYRMLANKCDAEDLAHDAFIKVSEKINSFKEESTFKTWFFQVATNLAYDHLRRKKRWTEDAQDKARELAGGSNEIKEEFRYVNEHSIAGAYEIKEHIDFCFTCISKTLLIEHQIALILKDIYDFKIDEISVILNKNEGVVKHLLVEARKTMTTVFDRRCALVNKTGTCHQCSELNGFFNPKQDQQKALKDLSLTQYSDKFNREELYYLRTELVKGINPLDCAGHNLQEAIMKCTKRAIGEI